MYFTARGQMRRCICLFVLAGIAGPLCGTISAETIISVTGLVTGGAGLNPVQSMARGWTQPGTFSEVSISATIGTLQDGTPGSGTVYLMNQIGPGATAANEIAETSFISTNVFTDTNLFAGLTLPPGTYYLVLSSPNQAFWDNTNSSNSPVGPGLTTLAPGVLDDGTFAIGNGDPYPPANMAFADPRNLLFSVTGNSQTAVPEPATWRGGVAVAGYLLLRRTGQVRRRTNR